MPSHKSTRPLLLRQSTSFLTGALFSGLILAVLIAGCDSRREEPPPPATPAANVQDKATPPPAAPTMNIQDKAAPPPAAPTANVPTKNGKAPAPPSPPLNETFDKAPQLSLFPRVGAFRPEEKDSQGLAFWNTFIDHMVRTSGMVAGEGRDGSKAWAVKSISSLDSVAFFAPLAVKPKTTYRVSFTFKGDLPEGASAGIGLLEFDEFLWIGEQYPLSVAQKHQTGASEGVRLVGKRDWEEHSFTFTTTPKTHMIHLILFREGPESSKQPVLFDDIRIEEAGAG